MPAALTEVTELGTALGMLGADPHAVLSHRPAELVDVPEATFARLADAAGAHRRAYEAAFANGRAFLEAPGGLRGRRPQLVEWRGPHRPPGDDVLPADLRVDHVYLVSCKYLSHILVNAGPERLFDRLLAGEARGAGNWFAQVAPGPYAAFYRGARAMAADATLPEVPAALTRADQHRLRAHLGARTLPDALAERWAELCAAVADASAARWSAALTTPRAALQLVWRLLRVGQATYFVLGSDATSAVALRVGSTWDWHRRFALADFSVAPRPAGQPEVSWSATVRDRAARQATEIRGHVEVRWSHGRFVGAPEAKVYLDTPFAALPGYEPLDAATATAPVVLQGRLFGL